MMWLIVGLVGLGGLPAALTYARKTRYKIYVSWYWTGRATAGVILSGTVLALWLCAILIVQTETRACEQTGRAAGYEAEWTLFTDCLVETPEGTFPLDQILELRNP